MPRIAIFMGAAAALFCSSFGFDGSRQGFTLGAAAGPGVTAYTSVVTVGSNRQDHPWTEAFGLATDFRAGYGFNETGILTGVFRANAFRYDNALDKRVTLLHSLTGIEWIQYLGSGPVSLSTPAPYVTVGLGLADWSTPFESNSGSTDGVGLSLGGGCEFLRHWTVAANAFGARARDRQGDRGLRLSAATFQITVGYFAY